MHTFNKTGTIVQKIAANNQDIIPLVDNVLSNALSYSNRIISFNLFLKNLKAYAKIRSIRTSALPNLTDEDNESQRLAKILDIEWRSPRKQLDLYISSGINWEPVGSVSLFNPAGYPYRSYTLMDIFTDALAVELGEAGKVGIAVRDVGHGLLTSEDEVTIHGSFVQEITVDSTNQGSEQAAIVNVNNYSVLLDNSGLQKVATANANRRYCLFQNLSQDKPCWLMLGGEAIVNSGIQVNPGGNYEIYSTVCPFYGDIYGIGDSVQLAVVNGVA